jgi:hypothetical protein
MRSISAFSVMVSPAQLVLAFGSCATALFPAEKINIKHTAPGFISFP